MPRVDKTAFTDYTSTSCEKQLRINLHPSAAAYMGERRALDLPHPQIRPALNEIKEAGNEWGEAKVWDLKVAFGDRKLLGGAKTKTGGSASPGLRINNSELLSHLQAGVTVGDFIVESEFDAATPTFLSVHGLSSILMDGVPAPLDFSRVRPDIIEVMEAAESCPIVTAEGAVSLSSTADSRLVLRVIDIKLTSEPGPRYFSELAYYSLALAAWLRDNHLEDRFAVSARAAVWPGNEHESNLQRAVAPDADAYAALHLDLVEAPLRIFVAESLRVLREIIPRVLTTPFEELPWAVSPGCQGCENLGQRFQEEPGDQPSDWDPRHCLPTAHATQDLSRLPFLSRGSIKVLRSRGHTDVSKVALLKNDDTAFDAHHRLRGQRSVVAARAKALTGEQVEPLDRAASSTAAIPGFAKLHLYVTADFDPGSAISLAFGLTWGWLDSAGQLSSVGKMRVHHTPEKSVEREWEAFSALLDDIDALLVEAGRRDSDASMQVYVWDELTLKHLSRVVSRHLATILASDRLARLAWLFPPEQVLGSAKLAIQPAVSVVKDAVRGLLSLNIPHNYSLLETARHFHRADHPNPSFTVPPFWEDPFSDQIPPERAHQLWKGRRGPKAPTPASLASRLETTVRSKLAALSNVTDHLSNELRGRLPREAPKISQLGPPKDLAASSHLGALLFAHAKLDAALGALKTSRLRALPTAEREARFESARIVRELDPAEAAAALISLRLAPQPSRHVFQLAPGSGEVKAKEGSFLWTLMPEDIVHQAHWSYARFAKSVQAQSLIDKWSSIDNYFWSTSLADVLQVTVKAIDRAHGTIVLDFTTYGAKGQMRQDLLDMGALSLEQSLVLDPSSADHFTGKLEKTIRAIGNPPSADRDPRIQSALGTRRNPRRSPAHPVESFLWGADLTADEVVSRDLDVIARVLIDRGHELNDSQWAAWREALGSRLTLVWGPPGTGKTSTVRSIVAALAEDAKTTPLRIAISAGTYTAIDNVLASLLPELSAHAPHVAVRRVRSDSEHVPAWLEAGQDVRSLDSQAMSELVQRLDNLEATIVAGPPQQLHRILASTAGSAAPVFDVVIIDEAGAIDVANALLVLAGVAPGATVIIAGDPKQLPPIHNAESPSGLEALVGSIYEFFEQWHGIKPSPLLMNYRSNQQIVDLGRRAGYPATLEAFRPNLRIGYTAEGVFDEEASNQPLKWPTTFAFSRDLMDVCSPSLPVVCLTYSEGISGQWNQFEAELVSAVVSWYRQSLSNGDALMSDEYFWREGIGVVTPHRAQRSRIVEILTGLFVADDSDPELARWIDKAVDTVERFQGQERDVIIASYAVGDPDTVAEEAEFLLNLNRFNVLATRARAKLIVVATRELVSHIGSDLEVIRSSEMLKDFVDLFCAKSRRVGVRWTELGVERLVDLEFRWH